MIKVILLLCVSAFAQYASLEKKANEFYQKGKFRQAILLYQKAEKRGAPSHLVAFNIGNAYFRSGEMALAAAAYKKSIRLEAESFPAVHFNLAAVLYRLKQWGSSIAAYHRALALQPDNASAWLYLAEVYNKSGDPIGAQRALEKAQFLSPEDVSIAYQLSEVLVSLQDTPRAITLIRSAYQRNPQEIDFLFYIGDLYRLEENWTEAISSYREGLLLQPENLSVMYKLADVLAISGQKFLALDILNKALIQDPTFSDAAIFLGNLAYDMKWWDKAANAYEKASLLNNEEGIQGLRNLAYELEQKGAKEEAIVFLEKASKLRPKDKDLAKELKNWKDDFSLKR